MAKRAVKGRQIGSSGFKREELDSLMVTILRLQPIGAEDWQMVVSAHFKCLNKLVFNFSKTVLLVLTSVTSLTSALWLCLLPSPEKSSRNLVI